MTDNDGIIQPRSALDAQLAVLVDVLGVVVPRKQSAITSDTEIDQMNAQLVDEVRASKSLAETSVTAESILADRDADKA